MFNSIWLTLKLSFTTTAVLVFLGVPFAYGLTCSRSSFLKYVTEAMLTLPLVLPPTVLGFYLLLVYSDVYLYLGYRLAFTFEGLLIGSMLYSIPFAVQPIQNAFFLISNVYEEISTTLRTCWFDYFIHVYLPMARRGLIVACSLCFAHTLGEFGIVLMVGGNIPNETQVISITIYEFVEQMEYAKAHVLSCFMLIISFFSLFVLFKSNINETKKSLHDV